MPISYILLASLGLLSGISSVYLGVGGSLFIVPLLPLLVGFSPLETLQISLSLIFVMSIINTLSFLYQKLILWSWVYPIVLGGLIFSFLSSFFTSYMTGYMIRLILWIFLFFMILLPFLLEKIIWLKTRKGVYIFGSLMGFCVGLTGLGGGFIISPYLHESKQMPAKNVSAVVCFSMFFTSLFAIFGQIQGTKFPFENNSFWWSCYFILLIPSILGLFIGYFLNIKDKSKRRRSLLLRFLVCIMFVKLSVEIFYF